MQRNIKEKQSGFSMQFAFFIFCYARSMIILMISFKHCFVNSAAIILR